MTPPGGLPPPRAGAHAPGVFVVDEETAEAIRRAWEEGGEPAGVVELRQEVLSALAPAGCGIGGRLGHG